METIEKIYGIVQKITNAIAATLLFLMVAIVFSNVMGRYFFHYSIPWTEEVARFMMIWIVFLGSVTAYVNNDHLSLDILVQSVPKKVGQTIIVLADFLIIYALIIIFRGGYSLTMASLGWPAPASSISYGLVSSVVPICVVIMILQTVAKGIIHIGQLLNKENLVEGGGK
jgi:TRAP-type transport system small permease protein